MGVNGVFQYPLLYQAFQIAGGFFGARVRAIAEYLTIPPNSRVIDVGCGPGFIVDHLPASVEYIGFDVDERYIAYARRHFGRRGIFHCQPFDDVAAAASGPADIVMMNGVIHHLDDMATFAVLRAIQGVLNPSGVLFTLDGCFHDQQSAIARLLIYKDRGRFVRSEVSYRDLLRSVFERAATYIREDLSWVPYTFVVGLSRPILT